MHVEDRLGRSRLAANAIRTIVSDAEPRDSARFVALTGPWGSGKSWVLEEVRTGLGGVTREFNPWLYSDELGLFRGFAAMLLEQVKDKKQRERIARALDFIGPSAKGFGFDASRT